MERTSYFVEVYTLVKLRGERGSAADGIHPETFAWVKRSMLFQGRRDKALRRGARIASYTELHQSPLKE